MIRASVVALLLCLPCASIAQIDPSADTPEPGSVEAIARATTDPRFSSPWVSYLPASKTVPSPVRFFGRIMGAPGELVTSSEAYAYCRALAASPRVRVFTIARSEGGRDRLATADEAGIRDLDRLKAATAALADPRRTDPTAAEKLVAGGRPIYYFDAALQSDDPDPDPVALLSVLQFPFHEFLRSRAERAELVDGCTGR